MAVLWDILDDIRQRLAEGLDVRLVLLGDGDVPASLLPAAKIQLFSVVTDANAGVPVIFDARVTVELLFTPKVSESEKVEFVQKTIESLAAVEYPHGARLVGAPVVRNNGKKSTPTMTITLRWVERSE